jgi:hypothetical protein
MLAFVLKFQICNVKDTYLGPNFSRGHPEYSRAGYLNLTLWGNISKTLAEYRQLIYFVQREIGRF